MGAASTLLQEEEREGGRLKGGMDLVSSQPIIVSMLAYCIALTSVFEIRLAR